MKVKLFKGGTGGTLLAQATTDADGYYFLNYKHKGKAVWYTVALYDSDDSPLLVNTSGTGNPGNVPLQANGFAEQNFYDSIVCSSTNNTGWVAAPYEITKGKFKTIVP